MGESFHHVLTELALLKFRYEREAKKSTIPVLLEGDYKSCLPSFISSNETKIWVEGGAHNRHQSLFKILLMFEGLERDRGLIESLKDCYNRSEDLLKNHQWGHAKYHREAEGILLKALRDRADHEQYRIAEKHVNRGAIREVLSSYSMDRSYLRRLSGEPLLGDFRDIDLVVAGDAESGLSTQEQLVTGQEQVHDQEQVSGERTGHGQLCHRSILIHDLFKERWFARATRKRRMERVTTAHFCQKGSSFGADPGRQDHPMPTTYAGIQLRSETLQPIWLGTVGASTQARGYLRSS